MNLSAVILTKNEEENIKCAIDSLKFCDEIIVVDDYSTDATTSIARDLGATVIQNKLNNDFAGQRNFAMSKCKGTWILFLDADERITGKLRDEIIQHISNPLAIYTGYYLKRKDLFFGKHLKYGETGNLKLLRLAKAGSGIWSRKVHEEWVIFGKTKVLRGYIEHYPHKNLKEFISKINRYSTMHAEANLKEGKKSSICKIMFMPFGKFVQNYVFKLGFLDGTRGFVFAFMMSLHSFLSWAKLWMMTTKIK
jgi:glycosyltransferase involved in cell wall biosynthesis